MDRIYVAYWTGSGNTQAMAECIGKGITEAGKQAEVVFISDISPDTLKDETVFALGCPAMGAEVLEESEMEPFVEAVESFAVGKKIALFGSYGWGDGQWMREWEERMKNAGAEIIDMEGLMANEAPDEDAQNACVALGKRMAALA